MITLAQYAGKWISDVDWTYQRSANAQRLIICVNGLASRMLADGVVFPVNPTTSCVISGKHFGGFRPQDTTVGAKLSKHKEGLAVDLYDPYGSIDAWCMANLDVLAECGIWIEHPEKTTGWSHWQCVPPKSGNRAFYP